VELLAYDIETYALWDDLDPGLQGYLERRARKTGERDDPRGAAAREVGLLPGVARVIAVGLWSPSSSTRLSWIPSQTDDEVVSSDDAGLWRCVRLESDLLRAFWALLAEAVSQGARLVSFNGRKFDGPVLTHRSGVLGIPPSVDLMRRDELVPHCDLREVLSLFGASRGYSLDYWCHVYGVPSPKGDLNGAGVAAAFEGGEHTRIASYALGDARATGELLQRVEPTLLPLLHARGD
jgi:hypothetical protein